jgi:hypothetical protein
MTSRTVAPNASIDDAIDDHLRGLALGSVLDVEAIINGVGSGLGKRDKNSKNEKGKSSLHTQLYGRKR